MGCKTCSTEFFARLEVATRAGPEKAAWPGEIVIDVETWSHISKHKEIFVGLWDLHGWRKRAASRKQVKSYLLIHDVCMYVCLFALQACRLAGLQACRHAGLLACSGIQAFGMHGWMAGWMAGWLAAWLAGWLGGWAEGWMDGWMDGCSRMGRHRAEPLWTSALLRIIAFGVGRAGPRWKRCSTRLMFERRSWLYLALRRFLQPMPCRSICWMSTSSSLSLA